MMKSTKLSHGVNLHTLTTNKFKTNIICLMIRRALRREEATCNALISKIMTMGCAKYDSAAKLAAQAERMFGAVYSCNVVKKAEEQIIQFFLEYLPKSAPKPGVSNAEALDFLSEVMLKPLVVNESFSPEITEGEKRTLHAQISARKNHKAEYARYRLLEEMCASEAFSIPGDGYAEDVEAITPQSAYAHYREILQTSPIEVMIIGSEPPSAETVSIALESLMIDSRPEAVDYLPLPQIVGNRAVPKQVHEHMPTNQGNIAIGYRGDVSPTGPHAYALLLANEIFGGYGNSLLFSVIRERESLAYAVSSTLYRFKSIVTVHAGVDSANFGRVAELVAQLLKQLSQGGTQGADIENAKKSLLKKYEAIKDYPGQLLEFALSQHMLGDSDELDEVIKKIRHTGTAEISAAAARLGIDTRYTLGE